MISGANLLSAIWFLVILVSAIFNIYLAQSYTESIAQAQARAMFKQIVLTRQWNARHGGVYVPVTAYTQPNPYLKVPDRDIETDYGLKLTKINPAFMTRQVSEMASEREGVQFRITSLDPLRPQNAPQPWESHSLVLFEQGVEEVGEFVYEEKKYRYMAPLITKRGCLQCHAEQGYQVGDIRGGISVTQNVDEILTQRNYTILSIIITHLIAFIISTVAIRMYDRNQRRLNNLEIEKKSVERSNAYKGAFIANISHELRTPLNAIIGMSDILKSELSADNKKYSETINRAGQQLDTMINHIINFSKIDDGTLQPNPRLIQLQKVAEGSLQLMKPKAQDKQLELSLEYDQSLPGWLMADDSIIQDILYHMLDNAVKYTDEGGITLKISQAEAGKKEVNVRIEVIDTGIGMPSDANWNQDHDLQQGEHHLTKRAAGLGLGLAMTRRLVKLLQGQLVILSGNDGTKVEIILPLAEAQLPEDVIVDMKGEASSDRLTNQSLQGGINIEPTSIELPDDVKSVLYRMQKLLNSSDAAVNNLLSDARDQLEPALGDEFAQLERMIDDFDYIEASNLVSKILGPNGRA